jgi:hypothetical protein
MSNKVLFKPFIHEKLGPLSIDRTKDLNNAVTIAATKIEAATGQEHQTVLDIVLSLGGCVKQEDDGPVSKNTQPFINTSWQDFLEKKRAQSLEDATTLFQIKLDKVPEVDDLSSTQRIIEAGRSQIDKTDIQDVAARLFASLFYVKTDGTTEELSPTKFLISSKYNYKVIGLP